jgi:hypothetical protein
MKNGVTLTATILLIAALHSFRGSQVGSIGGSIVPADGALYVWAFQNRDTVKTVPVNGQFTLQANNGVWKVIVDSKDPYKDVMIENVQVNDGKETNLGEIRLQR